MKFPDILFPLYTNLAPTTLGIPCVTKRKVSAIRDKTTVLSKIKAEFHEVCFGTPTRHP